MTYTSDFYERMYVFSDDHQIIFSQADRNRNEKPDEVPKKWKKSSTKWKFEVKISRDAKIWIWIFAELLLLEQYSGQLHHTGEHNSTVRHKCIAQLSVAYDVTLQLLYKRCPNSVATNRFIYRIIHPQYVRGRLLNDTMHYNKIK